MHDAVTFFDKKKPWSKYKDLILDYYLKPYLAKVARLGKPILVVDAFAGAGRFLDGNHGSPLIIAERLAEVQARGVSVRLMCIEADKELFARLKENVSACAVPVDRKFGDFRDYVDEIAEASNRNTLFLYLDPFKPSELLFTDISHLLAPRSPSY